MAVVKFCDNSKVLAENLGFIQVSNKIVEHIKDNDAFRVYCFLLSRKNEWRFNKAEIRRSCGIGEARLKKAIAILKSHNLIKDGQNRSISGRFINKEIEILDCSNFIKCR